MFELLDDSPIPSAMIKVIGVGGGGGNAVDQIHTLAHQRLRNAAGVVHAALGVVAQVAEVHPFFEAHACQRGFKAFLVGIQGGVGDDLRDANANRAPLGPGTAAHAQRAGSAPKTTSTQKIAPVRASGMRVHGACAMKVGNRWRPRIRARHHE